MRFYEQLNLAARDPRFRHAERRFQRTIVGGFTLVLLLMLASGLLGLYAMRSMGQNTRQMSDRYLTQTRLADDLQRRQGALGVLLFSMAKERRGASLEKYRNEVNEQQEMIHRLVREAASRDFSDEERKAWLAAERAVTPLFDELHQLIDQHRYDSDQLSILHRQFIASAARVMDVSYDDAASGQSAELSADTQLIESSQRLLVLSGGIAILCAVVCIVGSIALFHGLEKQAETLAKLSVHTLAEQEESARRFSQEIHDEFSQTLNAIESTLTVLDPKDAASRDRVQEAIALSKEAQNMAREMSQLLRPRILDDFGLDAGLRELALGFSRRTGVAVDYRSTLRERLHPSIETHLFRIVQEALTNASRHTLATNIELTVSKTSAALELRIADNGGGLPAEISRSGLGLLGMQERARAAGGQLTMASKPGAGLEIQVSIPLPEETLVATQPAPAHVPLKESA